MQALESVGSDYKSLIDWYRESDEVPLDKVVPPFPLSRSIILIEPDTHELPQEPELEDEDEKSRDTRLGGSNRKRTINYPYIPEFMPDLPPRRSFKSTPLFPKQEHDAQKLRKRKVEETRQISDSLTELHRTAVRKDDIAVEGSVWGTTASDVDTMLDRVRLPPEQ